MKPKNFPARKLERKIVASTPPDTYVDFDSHKEELDTARNIRTKKDRSKK